MRLTRKGFRAWLAGKRPSAIVGRARLAWDCPLSRYADGPIVPGFTRLPTWARQFVGRVDSSARCFAEPVTARRALEILDGQH